LGKVLVFARVRDKTGVVLDRFKRADKGRDGFNNGSRNTSQTEENLWYFALRVDDGINPDGRRPIMPHRLQSFHHTQINIPQHSSQEDGFTEISSPEAGSPKVGCAEVGTFKVSIAEIGYTEVCSQ